ncbi:MAG: hypothetical protein GF398_18685 [Chitinivibrionales bacterium]|nr:hypothetical protein [Chitinivibrionales bacterium]
MSHRLHQFLVDAYIGHQDFFPTTGKKETVIQIDDQDDDDILEEFCNIFVSVGAGNSYEIELIGNIPITQEINDFAEIYDGFVDEAQGRVVLNLNVEKIEALTDLSSFIRKTALYGESISNKNWMSISARTISSLHRFMRVIKSYRKSRSANLS